MHKGFFDKLNRCGPHMAGRTFSIREGICASSGSACASGSLEPSHVLMAMGLSREQARCSLRLTLNEENTAEEVDYIARQLSAAVERLRGLSPRWAEKTAGRENFLL